MVKKGGTMIRYNNQDIVGCRRWNGTAWEDIKNVRKWNGTAWEDVEGVVTRKIEDIIEEMKQSIYMPGGANKVVNDFMNDYSFGVIYDAMYGA